MKVAVLLVVFPLVAWGNEQEIRRALIERDQRSAEFARPAVEAFRQSANTLERDQVTREREAFTLTLEAGKKPGSDPGFSRPLEPLPLPGRPAGAVDPIPVQRGGG
jgi:hypothetical protein